MSLAVERFKFTTDDYFRLAEIGFLSADSRVELINGDLIPVSPKSLLHNTLVNRLTRALVEQLGRHYVIAVENTIRLTETSAPEPDFAVLDLRTDDETVQPSAADIYLIIEVSRSTLDFDRRVKLPLYASAGIPEVWIINAVDRRIEQYTQPVGEEYTQISIHRGAASVKSPILPLEIVVRDIIRR
jgi:Uma2 family endonuclease